MGIKGFFKIKIINNNSDFNGKLMSQLGELVTLKKLKGIRVCNDASNTIYQSILALESIQSLTDSDGKTTVHLNIILNKIIQQAQAGITQIWIFDSPVANIMKVRELIKRKERREKATQDSDKNNKEKIEYKLNKEHVEEVQFLLNNLGIMYIVAPPGIEAEQYGAYLTKGPASERFCKYMISGDSDVLFFGGNLLRISTEKSSTGKTKKTIYQIFELNDILNELNLNYDQFLKMGVSLGSDWNEPNEQRIGTNTIMKKLDNVYLTPTMEKAIEYYKSDISDKIGSAEIVNGTYNREKIMEFLIAKKFSKERLEKRLDDYEKTLS